jgi:hypothetical protein
MQRSQVLLELRCFRGTGDICEVDSVRVGDSLLPQLLEPPQSGLEPIVFEVFCLRVSLSITN